MNKDEDGQRLRARIVQAIQDQESDIGSNPTRIKFLCSIDNDQFEEILSYAEVLDHITQQEDDKILWKFCRIVAHEGPLTDKDPTYKGSSYNIMIKWETGEITSEPLTIAAADDPVTCALYARDNDLLDLPGWKRFKSIAKRQKKLLRMANQAKLRSFRRSPKYKYGYEVPKDYDHAVMLDCAAGNTYWQDAMELEMLQLHEYETFKDLGYKAATPSGYKKI